MSHDVISEWHKIKFVNGQTGWLLHCELQQPGCCQGQPQQQDLAETRVEVLVQTLQNPAAVVLMGLVLSQVSGRTLLCRCWEKKVLLTAVLCVSLHHQLEKIFHCDLPTELHVD